ncbi:PfkB family carbohydrate kinase [Pseudoxanthobacter sp. M-2]|uniref:PfkB family carbohydrate kinase n=1 Tax=Pseudoxanthobacter sp. M-2 TaxID=3078754 RepID=UPI0038FCE2B7
MTDATGTLDLVVVGSINVDLVVHADALPRPGETVSGSRFERFFGGKGANQAVAAARAGAKVGFAGAVGDDAFGTEARADLAAEGIDVAAVRTLPGVATGIAAIVVDAKGENQIALAAGANALVDEASAEAALKRLKPGGFVALSFEVPDAPLAAAARLAARAGARVVASPAPVRKLADDILAAHPLLVLNGDEAATLVDLHLLEMSSAADSHGRATGAALALSALCGAPVVITIGADGAIVTDGTTVTHVPGRRVTVVDTTGAGDTLAGVLAAGLAQGLPLDVAAARAVAAAALSVGAAGARTGMPTGDAIDRVFGEG